MTVFTIYCSNKYDSLALLVLQTCQSENMYMQTPWQGLFKHSMALCSIAYISAGKSIGLVSTPTKTLRLGL